jgi:hypothetical protein
LADRIVAGAIRVKWILGIVLAALAGSVAFELTGSSELAYIIRAITRGLT